jgi:hypothetical protein
VNGEPVIDFDAASVNARGDVTARIRTAENPFVAVRISAQGQQTILFQTGSRTDVAAPLNFRFLLGGAGPAPTVTMGGFAASLFEVSPQGLSPRLVVGDRLSGGAPYFGNYAVRDTPAGDLLVVTDQSLHRMSGTRAVLVQSFPAAADDGATIFAPYLYAANAQSVVMGAGTGQNHQRIVLASGGALTTLAYLGTNSAYRTASPAGGFLLNAADLSIDDAGRVMAYFNVQGGPSGYFLFDQGQWTPAMLIGRTTILDRAVSSARMLKTDGSAFYAILRDAGNTQLVCRYQGGSWTPVLSRTDLAPTGQGLNGAISYDVNRSGDVVINASLNGPTAILLVSGGRTRSVHVATEPAASGELLQRYEEVAIQDDGRVFFTAYDYSDHFLLYAAVPVD